MSGATTRSGTHQSSLLKTQPKQQLKANCLGTKQQGEKENLKKKQPDEAEPRRWKCLMTPLGREQCQPKQVWDFIRNN